MLFFLTYINNNYWNIELDNWLNNYCHNYCLLHYFKKPNNSY